MPASAPAEIPSEVAAAKRSDPAAWNRLLKQHELPLYVYILEMARDHSAARDILQDTFVSAVRHIRGLKDEAKFVSWLFGIAHQRCLQHWRQRQRDVRVFDPEVGLVDAVPGQEGEDPATLLLSKEREEAFFDGVARLPESQRAVVLLRVLEHMPLDEISEILGVPLGTVKSRLFHATQALKALLGSAS